MDTYSAVIIGAMDCPKLAEHTPLPQGYVGRQEWAAAMQRQGSKQMRCPVCGLWAVWRGIKAPLPTATYDRGCL